MDPETLKDESVLAEIMQRVLGAVDKRKLCKTDKEALILIKKEVDKAVENNNK